jgi:DNA-binding transcriptional regulator YdaS (Cro superfamily)
MGNLLKQWREAKGVKAVQAADAVGVTPGMWSRWETGSRKLPAERVTDISRLTGIPPHDLRPDIFEAAQ